MANSRACEMLARCLPSACEMLAISDARVCRPPKQNYRWITPELRQSPKLTTRFVAVMVIVHIFERRKERRMAPILLEVLDDVQTVDDCREVYKVRWHVMATDKVNPSATQTAIFSGICWMTSPKRSLPLACLLRFTPSLPQVPHCLKKKAAPCCSTWRLMLMTHSGIMGRA